MGSLGSSVGTTAEKEPEATLRLITYYKLVKGVGAAALCVAFALILATGTSVHLHGFASSLREHATAAWAVLLADAVVSVTERRHLTVATAALGLDSGITLVEWFALMRGHTWGEWLVVGATESLVPFEIYELVEHAKAGRVVILVLNLAIVAYLAHHAWKKHVARRNVPPPAAAAGTALH